MASKLKKIGKPRIIEIETALEDALDAYAVSETIMQAWARNCGECVAVTGFDLSIGDGLDDAKVLRIHTAGSISFNEVARTYPEGCEHLNPNDASIL